LEKANSEWGERDYGDPQFSGRVMVGNLQTGDPVIAPWEGGGARSAGDVVPVAQGSERPGGRSVGCLWAKSPFKSPWVLYSGSRGGE
jgi:hypothetical protein